MKNIYGLVVLKFGSLKHSYTGVSHVLTSSVLAGYKAGLFYIRERLTKFDRVVTAVTMKHK